MESAIRTYLYKSLPLRRKSQSFRKSVKVSKKSELRSLQLIRQKELFKWEYIRKLTLSDVHYIYIK